MQYMKLDSREQEALLSRLASMPALLRRSFEVLSDDDARLSGPDGAFSPVEQVWHLADLEAEGFAIRIRRLLSEDAPHLPDFDGAAIAERRGYRSLSLAEGLRRFEEARLNNVALLRSLAPEGWMRRGTQEGVGEVSTCDMPAFMRQHDEAHLAEIEAWERMRGGRR
jgi:hypothetical protein